jgi:hypothetical protein
MNSVVTQLLMVSLLNSIDQIALLICGVELHSRREPPTQEMIDKMVEDYSRGEDEPFAWIILGLKEIGELHDWTPAARALINSGIKLGEKHKEKCSAHSGGDADLLTSEVSEGFREQIERMYETIPGLLTNPPPTMPESSVYWGNTMRQIEKNFALDHQRIISDPSVA